VIGEDKPAPTSSVPEAELEKTEAGLVVESEGFGQEDFLVISGECVLVIEG
jgi:hypothetical protein